MVATSHPTPAATIPTVPTIDTLPRQVPVRLAAAYLECSGSAVRDMIHRGILPAHHHGTRSWRIDRDVLVQFAKGSKVEAAPATDLERRLAQAEIEIARCKEAICAAFHILYPDATGGRA